MYEKRNAIYHGGEDITLEAIKETSTFIPLIEKTSKILINSIIKKNYDEDYFELLTILDF